MKSRTQIVSEIDAKIKLLKKSLNPDEILNSNRNFDPDKHKLITGDVNFDSSNITRLGKLEAIGGDAYFIDSKITDLGNLKYIGGYANLNNSPITDLGNLEIVGGDVYLQSSKVKSLGKLKEIGGQLHITGNNITDFGKLETLVGGVYTDDKLTEERLNHHLKHISDRNIIQKKLYFIFKNNVYITPKIKQETKWFFYKKGKGVMMFNDNGNIDYLYSQ